MLLQKWSAMYNTVSDSGEWRQGKFGKFVRDSLERVGLLGDGVLLVEYLLPIRGTHPQPSGRCANSFDRSPINRENFSAFRKE
jgi:hypothetical protein